MKPLVLRTHVVAIAIFLPLGTFADELLQPAVGSARTPAKEGKLLKQSVGNGVISLFFLSQQHSKWLCSYCPIHTYTVTLLFSLTQTGAIQV